MKALTSRKVGSVTRWIVLRGPKPTRRHTRSETGGWVALTSSEAINDEHKASWFQEVDERWLTVCSFTLVLRTPDYVFRPPKANVISTSMISISGAMDHGKTVSGEYRYGVPLRQYMTDIPG